MFAGRLLRTWDPDLRTFGLGYVLLLPLYLAPLLVTRLLPGLDLPYHLVMVDMLNKQGHPGDPYGPFYTGALGAHPYAAHYLAVRLLSLVMPILAAHKLVIAIYVAGLPLAAASLLRACGRSVIPALLAFPLAYNLSLHYGFVSFALSLPVLLLLLAALARYLTDLHTRWPGLLLLAALGVLLFLCHLQNFLFGVCAVLAFVLFSGAPWRRRLLALAGLLPAIALMIQWQVTRQFQGANPDRSLREVWNILVQERLSGLGTRSLWADTWLRFKGIQVHTLRGFTDYVDVRACEALLVVLAGYVVLGLLGLRSTGYAPPARLKLAGWITFLGALLAYLGLPHHLRQFELMTFYPRFSVLAVCLALLVIPAGLRRLDGWARPLLLLPALAMTGLYGVELVNHYRAYRAEVADFLAVVKQAPPGGRALGLVFDRTSRVMRVESTLVGLPNLYPVLRPGPGSMAPVFYCGMRHMPCLRTPGTDPPPDPGPWGAHLLQPGPAVAFFDHFFIRLPPHRPLFGPDLAQLDLVAQQGTWLYYRRKPRK